MVRAFAHRLFSKFVAHSVSGWIFAGSAIAAEADRVENASAVIDLKIGLTIALVFAILAIARYGSNSQARAAR